MKVFAAVHFLRGRGLRAGFLILFLIAAASISHAQRTHQGRGAISAQDLAKMAAPAATGSDAADQVCARYSTGSVVSAPPELESQNGVLEVTMKFLRPSTRRGSHATAM